MFVWCVIFSLLYFPFLTFFSFIAFSSCCFHLSSLFPFLCYLVAAGGYHDEATVFHESLAALNPATGCSCHCGLGNTFIMNDRSIPQAFAYTHVSCRLPMKLFPIDLQHSGHHCQATTARLDTWWNQPGIRPVAKLLKRLPRIGSRWYDEADACLQTRSETCNWAVP